MKNLDAFPNKHARQMSTDELAALKVLEEMPDATDEQRLDELAWRLGVVSPQPAAGFDLFGDNEERPPCTNIKQKPSELLADIQTGGESKQIDTTKCESTERPCQVTLPSIPTCSADAAAVLPASPPGSPSLNGAARPTGFSRLASAGKIEATQRRKPTEEQEQILSTAAGNRISVVQAGAGTGKTTTLVMLAESLPGTGQYTAFNRSLVDESKSKFPHQCPANTIHSLGFRAEGKRFFHRLGGSRVRSSEVARMLGIEDFPVKVGESVKRLNKGTLASHVMAAVTKFCESADMKVDLCHFGSLNGIDPENLDMVHEHLLPFARQAWEDLSQIDGRLPFKHDHYVKRWQLSNPVISVDYLLVDEAQDMSPVMLDIVGRQHCKLVMVGDSSQTIYAWRGCVDALEEFPEAPRRYLTQSFRFGEAIANVANLVLDQLQYKTQLRLKGLPSIKSKVEAVKDPVAILCRTNAVAVANLLNAVSAGKRPFMVGGGGEAITFIEGARDLQQNRSTSHPELTCFDSWGEVKAFVKTDEGGDLKLMVSLVETFGADKLLSALKRMPLEKHADLVISTAHKSKGREWDSVRLAGDFPTKSKCVDADLKLLYVSVTRAKLVLDVTTCPFFTGQDSLDISRTATAQRDPTENTWRRWTDGRWLVSGPKGQAGSVKVTRKNGTTSYEMLGVTVWSDEQVAVYEVK